MRIPSRTCRAIAARSASSTLIPDSLAISMVTVGHNSLSALARATAQPFRLMPRVPDPRVVAFVGIDDVADQAVAHHVVAAEPGEVDVIEALEDVLDQAQPTGLARGQVDLGDVAGDHHPGAEAEPGQEHLHLFR